MVKSKPTSSVVDRFTGILLTPSPEGNECLGNGKKGYECCCDNCDYYLSCYPIAENKKEKV